MDKNSLTGLLPLEHVERGPVEWQATLPAEADFWSLPDVEFEEAPHVALRATASIDGGVHLTGRMNAALRLACRRCLTEVPVRLDLPVDVWFEPGLKPDEEADGVFGFDPQVDAIDLVRPLREELVLAAPPYPLCREACRGLCPSCGADRNREECDCVLEEPDPRWDRLRELLSES